MIGCVQFRNTADGKVAVMELAPDGSRIDLSVSTAIDTSDAPNFTFDFVPHASGDHDFCGIKTRNTGSGNVEVHVLSRSSGYNTFTLHAVTPFAVSDAPNFDFVMGKGSGHLIGVKKRNTGSGKVEVHVVSHISDYRDFIVQTATPIELAEAGNFDFGGAVFDNLACIKRAATGTGSVEVHVLDGDKWVFHGRTAIPLASVPGRTWLFEPYPAGVTGITNGPTASGFVEIIRNTATSATGVPAPPSNYRSILGTSRIADFVFKMIGVGSTAAGGGGRL